MVTTTNERQNTKVRKNSDLHLSERENTEVPGNNYVSFSYEEKIIKWGN